MMGLSLLLLIGGLLLAASAMDWADRAEGWAADGLALLAPVGVGLALVGVLLLLIPDFFDAPGPSARAEGRSVVSGAVGGEP